MADIQDHVAYLSQDIGSRPAGTEEEQVAAQYIANELQREAGLSSAIEDFNCIIDYEKTTIIVGAAAFVFALLSLFIPFMAVPAIIITAATAIIYVMEAFDRPVLSRMLSKGLSQNVVAHYVPDYSAERGGSRRRKVVLVAHYDSGRIRPDLNSALGSFMPIIMRIELICMIVLPFLVILHGIFLPNLAGGGLVALQVITIIVAAFGLIAAVGALLRKFAGYSNGANCNASGVGVLLGLAEEVSSARRYAAYDNPSPDLLAEAAQEKAQPVVHGREAALAAGVVPQDAELVYHDSVQQQSAPIDPDAAVALNRLNLAAAAAEPNPAASGDLGSAEERLVAAKMALAAFTGQPIENKIYLTDFPDETARGAAVGKGGQPLPAGAQMAEGGLPAASVSEAQFIEENDAQGGYRAEELRERLVDVDGVSAGQAASEALESLPHQTFFAAPTPFEHKDVPDWFRAAQAKAKKSDLAPKNVQRSQFADALDAAVQASRERAAAEAKRASSPDLENAKERLQQIRENIMNVKAPTRQSATAGEIAEYEVNEALAVGMEMAKEQSEGVDDQPQLTLTQGAAEADFADGKTVSFAPMDVFEEQEKNLPENQLANQQENQPDNQPITASEAVASAVANIPTLAAIATSDFEKKKTPKKRRKRQISLPKMAKDEKDLTPLGEMQKQPAPIAFSKAGSLDSETTVELSIRDAAGPRAREGLSALPNISTSFKPIEAQTIPAVAELDEKTRAIPPIIVPEAPSVEERELLAATGAIEGLTRGEEHELRHLEERDDDLFVVDADDSAYIDEFEEGGAYASASHVDMPKSRASRIFGRFRRNRKRNADEVTPQEWLDVEEDFDAREIGAARGSWESFQDESDEFEEQRESNRRWQGGFAPVSSEEYADGQGDSAERFASQRLNEFHNPPLNMEVWFVALGAELARDAGMKAFLHEHAQDMRGAIVIDIGALGAGTLSLATSEGATSTVSASSRMRRYVQKAADSLGLQIGEARLSWCDTAASIAQKQGHQAMHLVGMNGALPAYYGSKQDVFENLDSDVIQTNAEFVMELLRNI